MLGAPAIIFKSFLLPSASSLDPSRGRENKVCLNVSMTFSDGTDLIASPRRSHSWSNGILGIGYSTVSCAVGLIRISMRRKQRSTARSVQRFGIMKVGSRKNYKRWNLWKHEQILLQSFCADTRGFHLKSFTLTIWYLLNFLYKHSIYHCKSHL